jgi:hypothetical protein
MVGSFAQNFHEGTRSEYLALYFLSSLGTAVPVPHPEDTGLDLFCTIANIVGKRAWPQCFYSVQVKSEYGPWLLESRESVQWLVGQSFPIFLCFVDKKIGRLRIYQTLARHLLHAHPPLPDRIELSPEEGLDGKPSHWKKGATSISLGAAILDMPMDRFLDESFVALAKTVISQWSDWDNNNSLRRHSSILSASQPIRYTTNQPLEASGFSTMGKVPDDQEMRIALDKVGKNLSWVASSLAYRGNFGLAVRMALVLRHLQPKSAFEQFLLLTRLNRHFGIESEHLDSYFAALDQIDAMIEEKLPAEWKILKDGTLEQTGVIDEK